MHVPHVRSNSRAGRALRLAVVTVPLIACVIALSWPGVAALGRAVALGGLGLGLLAVARWLR